MAKVLYHVTMSLDGFIATPDHAMDWVFRSGGPKPEPNPEAMAVIESTGAALGAAGKDLLVLGGTVCRHRSTDVAHQYTSTKQAGLASCAITNAAAVACPAGSTSWARARAAVTNSSLGLPSTASPYTLARSGRLRGSRPGLGQWAISRPLGG